MRPTRSTGVPAPAIPDDDALSNAVDRADVRASEEAAAARFFLPLDRHTALKLNERGQQGGEALLLIKPTAGSEPMTATTAVEALEVTQRVVGKVVLVELAMFTQANLWRRSLRWHRPQWRRPRSCR